MSNNFLVVNTGAALWRLDLPTDVANSIGLSSLEGTSNNVSPISNPDLVTNTGAPTKNPESAPPPRPTVSTDALNDDLEFLSPPISYHSSKSGKTDAKAYKNSNKSSKSGQSSKADIMGLESDIFYDDAGVIFGLHLSYFALTSLVWVSLAGHAL